MEEARITFFAAMLFAIAFSTGMHSFSFSLRESKTKITASAISIAVLAFSIIAGLITASFSVPAFAQVGCFLLLSVSAVRRVLEMRNKTCENVKSLKSVVIFTSSDALVAGFGAGLGGINVFIVVIICIILYTVFIRLTIADNQNRSPMPTLGAILFISLAALL